MIDLQKLTKDKLPIDFFRREDTLTIAKELLGKTLLVLGEDNEWSGGMITEVEAYLGAQDKACHAYNYRKTKRNEVMFTKGGIAYVYFCYGMYDMLNFVTNKEGEPHAILIRAIKPTINIEKILQRRNLEKLTPKVSAGPGRLTKALNITTKYNGEPLTGNKIYVLNAETVPEENIIATPRIGIKYAEEDKYKPYRFYIKNEKFVSKPLYPKYE